MCSLHSLPQNKQPSGEALKQACQTRGHWTASREFDMFAQIWLQDLKCTSFSPWPHIFSEPAWHKQVLLMGEMWGIYNRMAFSSPQLPCFSPLKSIIYEDSAFAPFWKKWKEKVGEALLGCYQLSTVNLVLFRFTMEIAEGVEFTPVLSAPFQDRTQALPNLIALLKILPCLYLSLANSSNNICPGSYLHFLTCLWSLLKL